MKVKEPTENVIEEECERVPTIDVDTVDDDSIPLAVLLTDADSLNVDEPVRDTVVWKEDEPDFDARRLNEDVIERDVETELAAVDDTDVELVTFA